MPLEPLPLRCALGAGESQLFRVFVGLMDVSPAVLQGYMFWGLIFQVQVLKVRVINVGFKPFAPRGEALVLELPPEYGWSCWGWNLR